VTEFRTLSGEVRPPTSFELELQRKLRADGVADIYLDPEQTPQEWWNVAELLTYEFLASRDHAPFWSAWLKEMKFRFGLSEPACPAVEAYARLLKEGLWFTSRDFAEGLSVAGRLTGIETILDLQREDDVGEFTMHLNERGRWFRVGLRLEGRRFVPIKTEHLHQSIVQPVLLLLHDRRFIDIDDLYRKGFARYLQGDASGAITAATSAVETMLRTGLNQEGGELAKLCAQAQSAAWMTPAVAETAKKLQALRQDSDAHASGTDEQELALFALHIAGSVLLYLGETFPS
jgi:hypothetical protein